MIVDSLGLNEKRQVTSVREVRVFHLVLEGVETELRLNSWRHFTIPSPNPAGFIPIHKKAAARFMVLNTVCSDDEVDYIYSVLQGQVGLPPILVTENLEQIRGERPELYQKLKKTGIDKGLDRMELDASDVFG